MFTRKLYYGCIELSQVIRHYPVAVNFPPQSDNVIMTDTYSIGHVEANINHQMGCNRSGYYVVECMKELERVIEIWRNQATEEIIPADVMAIIQLGDYSVTRFYDPAVYDLIDDTVPF